LSGLEVMMAVIKVGVVGCAGRMGRLNLSAIQATEGCEIAGGTEHPESKWVDRDIGELVGSGPLGITISSDPETMFPRVEVVIDFSRPEASLVHAAAAARHKTVLVLGTTGFDAAQQEQIARAAESTAIMQAANMSLGVNLLLGLVEQAARALNPDYDIEIVEMHHRHKVDAPSGTALAFGRAAAAGRGVDLDQVAERVRDGHTGERRRGDIGFATLRGGDVAGEHSVILAGVGERIELTHKAGSREIFVRGALKATLWLAGREPGLYTMKDVLGLA
jgi:4-hydroxy-tetrahydrodipicolinate reductase